MAKLVLKPMRHAVYRAVAIPLGVVMLGGLALLPFNLKVALSVWLGGFIWFLPNGYFAFKCFHTIETNAKRFIVVFYRTELLKLILVAVLFIIVVKLLSVSLAGLIAGYLCAQMIFWIAMAWTK